MPAFVREIHIEAPQKKVWEAIADFGEIAKWSPVIKQSWRTGDVAEPIAVGSSRMCKASALCTFNEMVTDWREGEGLSVEIGGFGPTKYTRSTWQLHEHDGLTHLSASVEFVAKFGFIGALMAPLMAKKLASTLVNTLVGLKYYVEAGNEADDKLPAEAHA